MSDLLDRVRALAEKLGRSPTQKELRQHFVWQCGNGGYRLTSELLRAAGLKPRPSSPSDRARERQGEDRERIVARTLELAATLGRSPNSDELKTARIWSHRKAGWGRLRDVLGAAGLPLPGNRGSALTAEEQQQARENILTETRKLAASLGRSPTQRELQLARIWNSGRGGFDSIGEILDAAGLPRRLPAVRLGTRRDQTAVRLFNEHLADLPPIDPSESLDRLLAASERRSIERLRAFNAAHPFPPRHDADLAPAWEMA